MLVVGLDVRQPVAKLRQPNWHKGDGLHRRPQRFEILQRFFEDFAVIPAGTEHHLRVEADAVCLEKPQVVHDFRGVGVAQELDAHVRVGALHGDEQRRHLAADDAVKFVVVDVGHGDVVAHHQGQAPVVVLDVQRLAHSRRHLVDEAEDAVIPARARLGDNRLVKRQPQRLPVLFANVHRARLPACVLHHHVEAFLRGERLIVNLVDNGFTRDGHKFIARYQTEALGNRTGLYMGNCGGHEDTSVDSLEFCFIMRQLPPKVKANAGIARLPGQKCAFAGKFRPVIA